jgi:hypothetical protein
MLAKHGSKVRAESRTIMHSDSRVCRATADAEEFNKGNGACELIENVSRFVERVTAPVSGGYIPGGIVFSQKTGTRYHATKVSEVLLPPQVDWQTGCDRLLKN